MLRYLALALMLAGKTAAAQPPADWATSLDAAFLTSAERNTWKTLASVEEREQFKRRYWQQRDPTPETPANEFQELLLSRIRRAEELFGTPTVPGSRTARGLVYVVLGPPAVEQQTASPLDTGLERGAGNQLHLKRSALAATTWHVWLYDKKHTGDLLKALGVSSLELPFIVESDGRDQMQDHGRFHHIREKLARQSIANPNPGGGD